MAVPFTQICVPLETSKADATIKVSKAPFLREKASIATECSGVFIWLKCIYHVSEITAKWSLRRGTTFGAINYNCTTLRKSTETGS